MRKGMGKIDYIKEETKGIKVNGEWLNWNDTTAKFVANLKAGDYIEFSADDKNYLTFIRKTDKTENSEVQEEVVKAPKVILQKTFMYKTIEDLDGEVNEFCKHNKVVASQTNTAISSGEPFVIIHKVTVFYEGV